ncbi:PPE family protein [Mycobacterium simiae]|uniref:PPE family protein n=1 Tax=Mycobacterium simiae TaxID=1784 RepID=A0A5B1BPU6_MYCSI|nr:PPE family protein [Mycobacterium simiae]KAA1249343.1 PPE family protein [Mycobacterium simiae]
MDFGALPPEINSARMYAGPGSGPMLAAASGWDELATDLGAAAISFESVIARLAALSWHGPASAAMAAATAAYLGWMNATAARAEQAASQARAAAAAYAAAFAATVPPPVIAANRSLLTSLIATNILGQNAPAIAVTEAQYMEMWAQDATAMYAYAGSSAAATVLTPFVSPPQTTNPTGALAQAAAVAQAAETSAVTDTQAALTQLISTAPAALQELASPLSTPAMSTMSSLGPVLSVSSSLGWMASAGLSNANQLKSLLPSTAAAALAPAFASAVGQGALGSGSAGLAALGSSPGAAVSAGLGRAGLVGSMSVPQTWTTAAPGRVAAALTGADLGAAAAAGADAPGGMVGGLPLAGAAGRGVGAVVPDARFLERPPMVPRWSTVG